MVNRKLGVIVAALMLGVAEEGCTGAQAAAGAEMTCEIVRKICSVAGTACAIAPAVVEETTSGDEVEEGSAVAVAGGETSATP